MNLLFHQLAVFSVIFKMEKSRDPNFQGFIKVGGVCIYFCVFH